MSAGPITRIALDGVGGDHGLDVTVPAALEALRLQPGLTIVLVGPKALVQGLNSRHERLEVASCASVLDSGVNPRAALRAGTQSNVGQALQLQAQGVVHASVSAASTTALLTLGVKSLGLVPGVLRPALGTTMPTRHGETLLLDLGANLEANASHLVQFALMGHSVRCAKGMRAPRVGLLNVGHEDGKGHASVREAHRQLVSLGLNYQGFIEGDDLFAGAVDVAVCDGFSGNLVLKSSEGLARMLFTSLSETIRTSWRSRLGAWLARPALRSLLARFDPSAHNGAPLLGLNGVVVKSHGSSGRAATVQALLEAAREAAGEVPARIRQEIEQHNQENTT